MLPIPIVIFEVFGVTFDETSIYVLLILLLSIIVAAAILLSFNIKPYPSLRNKEELYNQFMALSEKKAAMKSKLSALEEMKNFGRIPQKEYEEQLARLEKEIAKITTDMDRILNMLATQHYDVKLQQEKGLEAQKLNLLVNLQKEVNIYKLKLSEAEGVIEDLKGRNKILESENDELKEKLDNIESSYKNRVVQLETDLDSARKGLKRHLASSNPGEDAAKYKEKMEEYYHKILLYQLLIAKYKDHIETSETKSVPDLKSLVQPINSNIVSIAQKIKSENTDMLSQYEGAYEFIDEIHSVPHIGTTFWLSIKDMLDNKVADYEDKAILLCSLLRGLGANAKILIASMTDGSNRPLVLITLKEKSILLDPNKKHDFLKYTGKRGDIIKQFSVDGNKIKRIVYEFNDKDYISYEA